jgi:hypothetical protein
VQDRLERRVPVRDRAAAERALQAPALRDLLSGAKAVYPPLQARMEVAGMNLFTPFLSLLLIHIALEIKSIPLD